MFKKKRAKITFKKHWKYISFDTWEGVSDSCIISSLMDLQEKYEFEILKIDISDSPLRKSKIVIKCGKSDKYNIFSDFCSILNHWIENVKF